MEWLNHNNGMECLINKNW